MRRVVLRAPARNQMQSNESIAPGEIKKSNG